MGGRLNGRIERRNIPAACLQTFLGSWCGRAKDEFIFTSLFVRGRHLVVCVTSVISHYCSIARYIKRRAKKCWQSWFAEIPQRWPDKRCIDDIDPK